MSSAFDGSPSKVMYEVRPSTSTICDIPILKWMPVDVFRRKANLSTDYFTRILMTGQLTHKIVDGAIYIDVEGPLAARLLHLGGWKP